MRVTILILALVWTIPSVSADELRLNDGEVLFGAVSEDAKGRLVVDTGSGRRTLKPSDVAERIEGQAPHVEFARRLAALQEGDDEARAELAAFGWRHGLDEAALALVPEAADGWPAPFARPGRVGPRWGRAKARARSAGGGNAATDKAARAALDWLASHQDADGRIDADGFMKHDPADDKTDGAGGGHHGERVPCPYDGVTTALAVMGWLAAGSTPVSGPYADNVGRGLGFLRSVVKGGNARFDAIWNLGFATHALADAYTVTRDPALRPSVERGVRALLRSQLADGGWRYFGGLGGVPSTSCAAVALGAARNAGIPLPTEAIARVLPFLDARVDADSGRSAYHDGAERLGYTPTVRNAASALAARGMLGTLGDTSMLAKQFSAITARAPRWKIEFKKLKAPDGTMREFQIGNLDPYAWYYTTIAVSLRSRSKLKAWYGGLQKALRKGQRKDGSFAGSWDPLGNYSDSGGRTFVTGLCALMLQAPYRYPAP